MILTLNQSPANSHTISRTSWLMMATFVLGYLGAGSYISSLVLLTKYNPKKNPVRLEGRLNKQLTRKEAKRIQRRKNIANQIKAFAILGGWVALTTLLWFIKPAFAAFDPGLLNILKWGCTILSPVALLPVSKSSCTPIGRRLKRR